MVKELKRCRFDKDYVFSPCKTLDTATPKRTKFAPRRDKVENNLHAEMVTTCILEMSSIALSICTLLDRVRQASKAITVLCKTSGTLHPNREPNLREFVEFLGSMRFHLCHSCPLNIMFSHSISLHIILHLLISMETISKLRRFPVLLLSAQGHLQKKNVHLNTAAATPP